MLEDYWVYYNGSYVRWQDVTVHAMCHSLGRGSGIFEVLSFHDTPAGPAVFRPDVHVERFFRTAAILRMSLSLTPQDLQQAVREVVRRNGLSEGFIKVLGFYGQVTFDILPPDGDLDVGVFAEQRERGFGGEEFLPADGIRVCVPHYRKLDPETTPIEAKVAAHYLSGMLTQLEARDRGFDSALMLDTQGFVAECATESAFLVKDGCLLAPALGTVLRSVTRLSVLEMARDEGIPVREERLPAQMLHEADEIFLASTVHKIHPVRQLDERTLPAAPGPLTGQLAARMARILAGESERFREWLVPV